MDAPARLRFRLATARGLPSGVSAIIPPATDSTACTPSGRFSRTAENHLVHCWVHVLLGSDRRRNLAALPGTARLQIYNFRPRMKGVSHPRLPNFFIVGTGKAGTTSLHRYLRQHPQIYMSPVKEPCYFASEIRGPALGKAFERNLRRQSLQLPKVLNDGRPAKPLGWLVTDWDDYLRLFQQAEGETAIGEASAAYLWSETAAANIHARIPNARIVMVLRDPAERAFSQYLHQLAVGLTRSTFRQHIEECAEGGPREMGVHYPFLEIGLYYRQVQRYLELFPRDRIRIYWFEEDWRQPARLLRDLFEFLEVDAGFQPDISRKYLERRAPRWAAMHYFLKEWRLWYPLRALVPPDLRTGVRQFVFRPARSLQLDPSDRQYLVDYYFEDVRKLAALLDRDLSAWLR